MSGIALEPTRKGLTLRLDAGDDRTLSVDLAPSDWVKIMTKGARILGLPDPWKG
jgi:hypothetical protein